MSERASIFDSSPDFDLTGFAPQKPKETAPAEKVRQVSRRCQFQEPRTRVKAHQARAPALSDGQGHSVQHQS